MFRVISRRSSVASNGFAAGRASASVGDSRCCGPVIPGRLQSAAVRWFQEPPADPDGVAAGCRPLTHRL